MSDKPSLVESKALLTEMSKEFPKLSKVDQLLEQGADINYQSERGGYTSLMLAVERGDEQSVSFLLQQNANPLIQNHHNKIASDIALNHFSIYQLLKNYELLFATTANDLAGVQAALVAGAYINFQGQGGYSAILIAVEQSCLEIVELLMVLKNHNLESLLYLIKLINILSNSGRIMDLNVLYLNHSSFNIF